MIRILLFLAFLGLALALPIPPMAQKSALAPEVESLVKAQSAETLKTSLRQEASARRSAQAAPATATPSEDSTSRNDLRTLIVAVLLMVAIAIRRYRTDAR